MDNKKIHARSGVSKQQQDAKKDNTGNPRQWPKNARRRESKVGQEQPLRNNANGGNNNANSAQQYRHNNDRRSRWNRNYNAAAASRTGEATGLVADADADPDEEEDTYQLETAEWDSVLVPGSKKHNLNHLLNFHYAPRDRDMPRANRRGGQKGGGGGGGREAKSSAVFYNKDQFLQANCNFIVKDSGDYKAHWNNADSLVDWQLIEEVVIRSAEEPKCPICLFPPVAAKMTKCGHVYCWPCILHYLALSDKEWRKCPICYDAVRIKDLRSTVSWPYHEYQLNETVDFQLMCRRKGELEVVKVSQECVGDFPHLFDVRERQIVHSKLILANKTEVSSILDRERCELLDQMRTDGPEGFDCPETMFITQALDLLEQRTKGEQVEGMGEQVNVQSVAVVDDEKLSLYDGLPVEVGESSDAEEYHYFYQAVDGQHLYLHSINLRMLQAQFGSLANCPPVLTGKIIQREHFSVSDALRKRSKYLQHLPLTSIITIVEVIITDDVLSTEVKEQFVEEVNQRKKDRQRRARDEKKREKQINELNDKQMGKFMAQSAGFVREEADYYPFLTISDDVDANAAEGATGGSNEVESISGSPKPFSFAKMLQCTSEIEKAQPAFWPTLEPKRPQTTSIWGANSEKPRSSKLDKHFPNLLDTIEVEEEENQTSRAQTFGGGATGEMSPLDKGATAWRKSNGGVVGPKGNSTTSKRTPKKKQQMLFSTDMNFNRN